jgi:hypothetical protein
VFGGKDTKKPKLPRCAYCGAVVRNTDYLDMPEALCRKCERGLQKDADLDGLKGLGALKLKRYRPGLYTHTAGGTTYFVQHHDEWMPGMRWGWRSEDSDFNDVFPTKQEAMLALEEHLQSKGLKGLRPHRTRRLGAASERGGGGLTLPFLLLVGVGGYVLFRAIKARREAEADSDGGYEREEPPATGPCADIDNQLATPKGCGRVQATGYKRGEPSPITLAELPDYPGFYLQAAPVNVWAAFQRMLAAARRDGIRVGVNSAFRTMAKQTELYEKYLRGQNPLTAKPGRSTHQMGLTVDLAVRANPQLFPWLVQNANRFGFFKTVASEDWHWEYKPDEDQYAGVA